MSTPENSHLLPSQASQAQVSANSLAQTEASLRAMARTIGALERKIRHYEEEKEQVSGYSAFDFARMSRSLQGSQDHVSVLRDLVDLCVRETGAGFALGLLWDGDRECFKRMAARGEVSGLALEIGGAEFHDAWDVFLKGEAILFSSVFDADGLALPKIWERSGVKALLPLAFEGVVLGMVALGDRARIWSCEEGERGLLSFLGQEAASSIHRCFLHMEGERTRYIVDRERAEMNLLRGVIQGLSAKNITEESAMNTVLELLLPHLGVDRASVMLWDSASEFLRVEAVKAREEVFLEKSRRLRRGEGVAGRVFEAGQAQIVSLVGGHARAFLGDPGERKGLVCVPLRAGEETLGVLNLSCDAVGDAIYALDMEAVQMVADLLAQALQKIRLVTLATLDPLTGAATRRSFAQKLSDEIKRAQRFEHSLSLVLIDLDHFKGVNDTYGHLAGDEVLRTVSSVIRENVREEIDVLGRYGGDEFALLLPETDEAGARILAERLLDKVRRNATRFGNSSIPTTLSMGVASLSSGLSSSEDLIQRADDALYEVKRRGRNGVEKYSALRIRAGRRSS